MNEVMSIRHPSREADWELAKEWTESDPYHCKILKPDFWFESRLNVQSFVLEDSIGVVFFYRLEWLDEDTIDIHIQFPPATEPHQKARVMNGLTNGLKTLRDTFKEAYSKRSVKFIFTSESPSLIRFCTKHLGFQQDGNVLYIRG